MKGRFSRRQTFAAAAALPAISSAEPSAAQLSATAHGSVSVVDFGARGDGREDDAKAFQAALDTGRDVTVPPAETFYRVSRSLAMRKAGQRICGSGRSSRVVRSDNGLDANLLVTEHDDCVVMDLDLTPGQSSSTLFDGWAIGVVSARRVTIQGCRISQMRRGGILLSDSSDCRISNNLFVDSLVKGDGSERQSDTGFDILIAGSSSDNLVMNNQCLSGVGVGIGCQTVTSGKSQRGNMIRDNVVREHPCYGLMVYLNDPSDGIDAVTIDGNSIERISGSIRSDGKTLFYGSGIYIQTSNDVMVIGNRITGTNLDRTKPFSGGAVPAAIGLSGYGNAIVLGNMIDGCHHGIASIQTTLQPRAGDGTIISDNMIRNCDGVGVLLADNVAANVHDNRMLGVPEKGTHGVLVQHVKSDWMTEFAIRGNEICDFHVGIEISGAKIPHAEISSNHVTRNRGYPIYCSAAICIIHHNSCDSGLGIVLAENAMGGLCKDNIVRSKDAGIVDHSRGRVAVSENVIIAPN